MTTVLAENVHTLAVEGTFDDCQDVLKVLFADAGTNEKLKLGAVNSINFARIVAQIVYYFHAYFRLAEKSPSFKIGDKVRLVTPTGNFGNILAGYFAVKMGLPVEKLVGRFCLFLSPPLLPLFRFVSNYLACGLWTDVTSLTFF